MDIAQHIGFIASEGELFAAAAEQGGLGASVPPCPGWDMRELVRHLGLIHVWAAGHVAVPHDEVWDVEDLTELAGYWPDLASAWPEDDDLIDWYRETNTNLVRVLEAAPPDVESFTFLPAPSPLAMWARRQASETAIHRFDAEVACGIASHFDPQFAADALDELLSGFGPGPRPLKISSEKVFHAHATDTDDHWFVTLGPERTDVAREGGAADLTLTGTAAELYLLLWNRTPNSSVAMDGNTAIVDLWHENCRVRWS